jgi:hypothetical protein
MRLITLLFFLLIIQSCASDKTISIQDKLQKEDQSFFINTSSDTIITGKEGTKIFIEKESFRNALGDIVTDSVIITMQEFYKNSDIIASNLNMRSGDKILETGGMIELRAYAKGNQLSLRNDKSMVVHFPKKETKNDSMRLFYGQESYSGEGEGEENIVSDGKINWDLEESSVPKKKNNIWVWYHKYEGLDTNELFLANGQTAWDTVSEMFSFNQIEIDYFLNKAVKVHYDLKKNGNMIYDKLDGSLISNKMAKRLEKVVRKFPKCKPYTIAGNPIEMPGWFQIWTEITPPKFMNNQAYLQQIENKFSNPDSTKSAVSLAELQYYIFDSKQLGWMNCDQFINPNPVTTDFVVQVPQSENVFAKIIFKNYKTVMIGNEEPEFFTFEDLPIGEPVSVIVIDQEDEKVLFKIEETEISEEVFKVLELQKGSLKGLKKALDYLN